MNRNIFSIGGMSKLNSFLQAVGVLGIIASLIFVGFELRQTQKIALASQNQARTETLIQGSEFLYKNGLSTHEWLTNGVQEKDRDLIATYKHMAWWIYNNDYSQYKAGLMEKSLFEAKRDGPMARNVNGKNYVECIISKEVWNVRQNNFQPDFAELINSLSKPCRDLAQQK